MTIPVEKPTTNEGRYDIFPAFQLPEGAISVGFETLARRLSEEKLVILDGYQGVFFELLRTKLEAHFSSAGIETQWYRISDCMKTPAEAAALVAPYLGGDDPLFGYRTDLELEDFFDRQKIAELTGNLDKSEIRNLKSEIRNLKSEITVIYGTGASLVDLPGYLVYVDLPKNEMQYRARAGLITNLGADKPLATKVMYKRFYFVDWVVLNRHKEKIFNRIDIICDGQRREEVTWLEGSDFRSALSKLSCSVFRVRPWFEPGAWGGNWIKNNIPGLPGNVPNYAWSFEMIVPENGILLEDNRILAEVSFDWLMIGHAAAVLGNCHARFQQEFPIRFDFLDTFDGGNLSVQCHPRENYIRENFGENFTQQEAYYILDTKDNAMVNLGFQEEVTPGLFRQVLEKSAREKTPVDIPAYIQQHPAHRHDLFLIPDGTVHGSGINNLVLEISTTPYIFTFKMYDWLRLDLDGKPRDLNIARALENLDFSVRGDLVAREFISKPVLLESGADWKKYHLPTHPRHYYDVWRYQFSSSINIENQNDCHVLNLVQGRQIVVKTANGVEMVVHFAETFTVPAAAGSYEVRNQHDEAVMLVVAFIKTS